MEISKFISAPFACAQLAEMGAEVIKVEKAGAGDDGRVFAPLPNEQKTSLYFTSFNRNKKSIEVDFRDPKGKEIIRELIKKSDVLVTNYRPQALKGMGLTHEDVSAINPNIIELRISGFGQSGPHSSRPAFDPVISYNASYYQNINGSYTYGPGIPADHITSLYAAQCILSALVYRERTGKGCNIDLSMLCSMLTMQNMQAAYYYCTGELQMPPDGAPGGVVPVKDGAILIVAVNPNTYGRLSEVVGGVLKDPQYNEMANRIRDNKLIMDTIHEFIKDMTCKEAEELFVKNEVPVSIVKTWKDVFEDPQIQHLGNYEMIHVDGYGEIPYSRHPMRLVGEEFEKNQSAPILGEHNEMILKDILGYNDEQIAELPWMKK
ncbi:MAG: CoA transferase [Christensenellaceae bacterium]|nr:CoA transferase [Christensenellaceae bacterium]